MFYVKYLFHIFLNSFKSTVLSCLFRLKHKKSAVKHLCFNCAVKIEFDPAKKFAVHQKPCRSINYRR